MSEPLTPALPRPNANASTSALTRDVTPVALGLQARLQVGMQLELQPARLISAQLLEARLRPVAPGNLAWTQTTTAQLTKPLAETLLRQLAPGPGASPVPSQMPALRAEVVSISPTLVLRIVAPEERTTTATPQTPNAGSREWLGQQFRHYWPESRPLTATLETLSARLREGGAVDMLPGHEPSARMQIQRTLESLVSQLATPKDLTDPERLAVAITRSGLWLEAQLAQAATTATPTVDLALDLKAQLLTLAQRVRMAPTTQESTAKASAPQGEASSTSAVASPATEQAQAATGARTTPGMTDALPARAEPASTNTLARDVEGMIKQVVTNQLQTLDSAPDQTHWVLELPFRTPAGLLALEADIRREHPSESSEEDAWSMRIRLNLPRLGPLNILLSLRAERLNASIQAEWQAGADTILSHLDTLRAQLQAREIDVASLHAGCRPGEAPPPPFQSPLVREQA